MPCDLTPREWFQRCQVRWSGERSGCCREGRRRKICLLQRQWKTTARRLVSKCYHARDVIWTSLSRLVLAKFKMNTCRRTGRHQVFLISRKYCTKRNSSKLRNCWKRTSLTSFPRPPKNWIFQSFWKPWKNSTSWHGCRNKERSQEWVISIGRYVLDHY